MKRIIVFAFMMFTIKTVQAQIEESPVKWSINTTRMKGDLFLVIVKANIQKGWHIYAQCQPEDAISTPTSFSFFPKSQIKVIGKTKEKGTLLRQNIKALGITQNYYANEVEFLQQVHNIGKLPLEIAVKINYMTCTDVKCLPEMFVELKHYLK